jgi:hypothetical protein
MFRVRCQSASGRTVELTVAASTGTQAAARALKQLPRADGFLAVWALEA